MRSSRRIVAIHQPNFFPWLGYFNKIARADIFLIMDNVQFPRTGKGTWVNRVKLIINKHPRWATMPVVRASHGIRCIREMQIDNTRPWRVKLLKSIQMSYSRAPFFEDIFPILTKLVNNPTDCLTEYNVSVIHSLTKALQFESCKFTLGSSLDVEGNATELLISMVKAVDGTAYICGGGAAGYQEDEKFAEAGVELIYQNFQHPLYSQSNTQEFIPGLSIIDALMNCGFEETQRLIESA